MPFVEYPYECQAKGHQGGSRTFTAAPPEWFASKGRSTPKNCPECREWTKAQVDEKKACATCGLKIRIPATLKISIHKKVGPYVPITECRSCRDGNQPPKGTKRRPDKKRREKEEDEEKLNDFSKLPVGITPQVRKLITSEAYYHARLVKGTETGAMHILRHVPGSPYDATGSGATSKSPSSFADGPSLSGLLRSTQWYLSMTDEAHVREYQNGKRIRRVTFTGDHSALEVTILQQRDDGRCVLITTYDNVKAADISGDKRDVV